MVLIGLAPRAILARTPDRALLAILAAALAARWAVAYFVQGDLLSRPWEYEAVALNLLNGRGFVGPFYDIEYRAHILPFYPALCAAVYWAVGQSSLAAIQVVHAAAVVPAGWCAYDLAAQLGGRWAGRLAAIGVTFHPALLLFSLRRHALWIDAVIFLALLWATFRSRQSYRLSRDAGLGILFGVAMLSRATIAPFMLLACGWLVWQWRGPVRVRMAHAALIVGIASLFPAAWLVRNALVFGRPAGLISTTSYNLWIGNNPHATGSALAPDGRAMESTAPGLVAVARGRSELEQGDVFRDAALDYMREYPGQTLLDFARKFRRFLFWSEQTGAWYPAWFRTAYLAFYLVLMACAVVGGYRLAHSGNWPAVMLCVSFVVSIGVVQSIFFVEGRHRWEVESGLIVLAASAIRRPAP